VHPLDQSKRVVNLAGIVVGLDDWLPRCLRVSSVAWMACSSDQRGRPFVALDSLAPSDQVRHNCSRIRLICLGSFSRDHAVFGAVERVGKRC
jgi:hypothetical protein